MEGDAMAPMTASVASVTFSCFRFEPSVENRPGRARRGSRWLQGRRSPSFENRRPSFASRHKSLAGRDHGLGGVSISVGSMKSATRAASFRSAAALPRLVRRTCRPRGGSYPHRDPASRYPTVGEGRRTRKDSEAAARTPCCFKCEVADDFGPEQAVDVRCRGNFESRPNLFSDARAAHAVPPLEYQDAPAGASEVSGSDQAVVSGADDDDVVGRHSV